MEFKQSGSHILNLLNFFLYYFIKRPNVTINIRPRFIDLINKYHLLFDKFNHLIYMTSMSIDELFLFT